MYTVHEYARKAGKILLIFLPEGFSETVFYSLLILFIYFGKKMYKIIYKKKKKIIYK